MTYNAILLLETGEKFWGYGLGKPGIVGGELCFNTSMTGYQEVLSDPSYAKQIINFTCPHIGNVGANWLDVESKIPFAAGLVTRMSPTEPSNYRHTKKFLDWITEKNLVGIYGVDTRTITHRIRKHAPLKAFIINDQSSLDEISVSKILSNFDEVELITGVEWLENKKDHSILNHKKSLCRILIIDYGCKQSIIDQLTKFNIEIVIHKGLEPLKDLTGIDGVLLSNGPGDPAKIFPHAAQQIQQVMAMKIPILAICLGYQLFAIAIGAKTYKLPQGHRGINHPVVDVTTKSVIITSQNHGYAVVKDSLPEEVKITHLSLFDQTLEGFMLNNYPALAVQFHPEASPGPHDAHFLFKNFSDMVNNFHAQKQSD